MALSDLFALFSSITLLSVALLRTSPFFDNLYATLEGLYVLRRAKLVALFTEVPRETVWKIGIGLDLGCSE